MIFLFRLIKIFAQKLGLEINRYNVYSSEALQTQKILSYYSIETVLDIGANKGQYALDLRDNGYRGKIISFEPLTSAHDYLLKISQKDPSWVIGERVALGDKDDNVEINISANLDSSSILPIMDCHISAAPNSAYIGKETVSLMRLDSIAEQLNLRGNILLKVDVQGFELNVLKGAENFLKNTTVLQLELSFVELYEGQPLIEEMTTFVKALGFELHALIPVFIDESSGCLLQVDGFFINKKINP